VMFSDLNRSAPPRWRRPRKGSGLVPPN
jgi:hypothetical protein